MIKLIGIIAIFLIVLVANIWLSIRISITQSAAEIQHMKDNPYYIPKSEWYKYMR